MATIKGEILIVDDNLEILSLTKGFLAEKGYKVRVAKTGQQGLASCRLSPPDIVLLDLHLPDLTGYAVCRILKAEEGTQDVPIVFVSASHETIDQVHGFEVGAVDYISKPFQEAELLARISTHLTNHSLKKQLTALNESLEQRVAKQTQEISRAYRVTQSLSEELMFHPLLCKIVQSACEGCEAPKGMLVLKEEGQFAIRATYTKGVQAEVELQTVFGDSPLVLPWSIMTTVDQTQKPLIYDLQTIPDGVAEDPYMKKHQPSLLACLPLSYKDEGVGILFLEYDHEKTNEFGDRDIRFLQALLTQGSISLGHARLYQSVKDKKESLRILLENAPDAIVVFDVNRLKFCEVNHQATIMFGWNKEALQTKNLLDLSPPTQQDGASSEDLAQHYLERVAKGELVQFEWMHQDRKGRIFPCEVRLVQLPHQGGNLVRASILDISSRKQAEEELRQKDAQIRHMHKLESLGTMAGGIAHDFNNILASILGYTHLLNNPIDGQDRNKEFINAILAAGNRAKDLIRQMLVFCCQTEPAPELVFLDQVFQETLILLRGSLPSTIEIRSDVGVCGKPVWADPTQIQQVLLNLSNNAGHAMRENGGVLGIGLEAIVLTLKQAQELNVKQGLSYRLWVQDTGHGITPENQPKIFDPFFTTKSPQEGTGLGLSVTHSIIVRHGGAITVNSTPGVGTTFEIFLPQARDTQERETVHHPELSIAPVLSGLSGKILFVEDEPSISFFGKEILLNLGYTVQLIANGKDALALFSSSPDFFDAVITDLTMPHMTGDVLAKHLLKLRPDLPIILCTGFSHSMTREMSRDMGILGFLQKPYHPAQLVSALENLLRKTATSSLPSVKE